jgi:Uma2 family endonuclease
MATPIAPTIEADTVYPESDGKPMADNTKQFRTIVMLQGGFDAVYANKPDVLVVGDLLWYPVEGRPDICQAPDTMIIFGRPKGDRGSYKQWVEGNIAPQVVFEVLSPSNTAKEMERKLLFYQRYGVEEYYVYDPDQGDLRGYMRYDAAFEEIDNIQGWISPRTNVVFLVEQGELVILGPDDKPFKTYVELERERTMLEQRAIVAENRNALVEAEAANEREARQQAEEARQQAEARAAQLAERLRAFGIDPENA